MRAARIALAGLVVAATALSATGLMQVRLDDMRTVDFDDELLYLPNEKLLTHFTAGTSSVVADLLWLKCIQYTSKHFQSDHKFTWLGHMTDVITRLDPYYVDVYRYGGMFLASLKADNDASIDLMLRGYLKNPDAWGLPYEIAMVYLLNRRDEPGSAQMAARYLHMAVATERAPGHVVAVLQGLQRKHNLFDIEQQIWTDLLETSEDKLMRDLAERKLHELAVRRNVFALQEMVDEWTTENGAPPSRLEDLVAAGWINALPSDPRDGRYFLGPEGEVENTLLLDLRVERARDVLRSHIATFKDQCGRYPATLEEMVDMKVVRSVPRHPYPDREWSYDPVTGEVQ